MNKTPVIPELGMGATWGAGSDCYPATVVFVSTNKKLIRVRDDNYKRTDKNGQSENKTYEYSPNPNGRVRTYTLRKNGRWIEQGSGMKSGASIGLGHRRAYWDPHF